MDRLKAMQSFARVMHAGNFSIAARQLGVSRALISRRIMELERHLGFALLQRSTRNVVPTDEAGPYLEFCERILREIEREQSFVRYRDKNASTLKIVAPKSFGTLKLADALFRSGKDFEVLPLSGLTHMVPDAVVTERLWSRVVLHFRRHLGQAQ